MLVLCLGLLLVSGLVGCKPSTTPSQERKGAKVTLSPQAMEHLRKGHKLMSEQKLDEALKEFQETARLQPEAPQAHLWLGMAYVHRHDRAQAEQAFKKALELDPRNYQAMTMLGKLYTFERANLDEAQKYLQQALDESPENLEAHFDLGRIYAMKGDKEKASQEFNFIFAKEAEIGRYHYEIGRMMETGGDNKGALTHYQRALVLNPRLAQASQEIQRLEEQAKKEEKTKGGVPKANVPGQPGKKKSEK
jgi:tetratricopeptide (TPR) repeat protein